MANLFISYSRYNAVEIEALANDLDSIGHDIWFDKVLTGGQRWWNSILNNIESTDIFIFAVSKDSLSSAACRSELQFAADLNKHIIPVSVADEGKLILPPSLSEIQVVEYFNHDKSAFSALIKAINTLPAAEPPPDVLPSRPSVPISYLTTVKERIDTPESLDFKEQLSIVIDLKGQLKEIRSVSEIRALLLDLRARADLLAKVDAEIEEVLAEIDSTPQASSADIQPPNKANNNHSLYCYECGSKVEAAMKFCSNCGSKVTPTTGESTDTSPKQNADTNIKCDNEDNGAKQNQRRSYICRESQTESLLVEVEKWLSAQGYQCQKITTEEGSLLLQVKNKDTWKNLVGMATSLNVVFHQKKETLVVEIGAGKWIDKAVVGTISMFILWPLAVTAGFGAWKQAKLPEKIYSFIDDKLRLMMASSEKNVLK